MHIAMIGVRGIPARSGGAEHVVEELSRELSAMGHEVLVYSRRAYVDGSPPPPWAHRVITPALPGKHLEAISHTATALADARRRRVDLVHLHGPGPALLSWLPALARLPVVLTIHAPDWQRRRWSWPARLALQTGLAVGLRCAAAVTAVSWPLAQDLTRRFGMAVTYIPNGVRFPPAVGAELVTSLGLQPRHYGLAVGRIVPEKRLDLLLRAWTRAGTDWPLVVVGQVQDRSYGRLCRRLAKQGNVCMLGERTGDELSALCQNSGFVLLPSELEGMSLVLLEAAANGCCILAADIPANSATMQDSILYFKCNDADDLAIRISRLIPDLGLREEYARRARQKARQYDWAESARQMEGVYRLVTGRKERS